MKKKLIFAIATGFFAVATVFNMTMLKDKSAGDVSLEGIAVMEKAFAEPRQREEGGGGGGTTTSGYVGYWWKRCPNGTQVLRCGNGTAYCQAAWQELC